MFDSVIVDHGVTLFDDSTSHETIERMPPKLLVFDLDGTLIDSRIDLTNSVNAMLAHFGKPTLAEPTIASYIGDGVMALVRRSLAHAHLIADQPDPHDDAFVEQAVRWFIAYYKVHKLDCTTVYPGVLEAMQAIRNRNPALLMAVLTNKPVMPSRAICRHFGFDKLCFQVYGGNSFVTKKPDPDGLRTLIAEASTLHGSPIQLQETVMIGDSHVDIETARAAGTRSLGCSYGLSPESLAAAQPDITVDHASDWPAALKL
jgi:phosphoglycolate phosphatase